MNATAIERAYDAGLLKHETHSPEALRYAGKLLFQLYWSHYADLSPTSATYRMMVAAGAVSAHATDQRREVEQALKRREEAVDTHGRDVRRAVESLCIDHHFEFGPSWLDRLIGKRYGQADRVRMNNAIIGLSAILEMGGAVVPAGRGVIA